MKVLTAAGMKSAEANAVAAGTSYEQLMENAGTAAAHQLQTLAARQDAPKTVLFLCGRGNNAGDAFVMARLLAPAGWACQLLPLCGDEYSTLAKRNLLRLPPEAALVAEADANFAVGVIVDGVFGTGFHGQLPAAVQAVFRRANAQPNALRIALDLPSGMATDSGAIAEATFHAHHTLTFGAYKPGLLVQGNAAYTGQVHCLDIGL